VQRSTAGALRLGIALVIVLLLASAGIRTVLVELLADRFQKASTVLVSARSANLEVLQDLSDVETGIRGYQLTGDRSFLQPTDNGRQAFPFDMATAIDKAPDDRTRALLRAENGLAISWLAGLVAPIADLDPAELPDPRASTEMGERIFDQIRDVNTAATDALGDSRDQQLRDLTRLTRIAEIASAALSVLAVLALMLLGRHLSRIFLAPLNGVRETLVRLVHGDHGARAQAAGPPEIREVIRNLNELCDESDRLRAGEQRRMHLQVLAHDISSRMRQSLERGVVLDQVVAGLGRALGVHRVYVQLFEDGRLGGIARQWHTPGLQPLSGQMPNAAAIGTPELPGKVDVSEDAATDNSVRPEFVAMTGAGAYVRTTFGFDADVFGIVVLVQVGQPRRWLPDELALADSVSAELGRAFEHVRLYEHERDVAERMRDIDQQKTDFIATVSHELRTPLTSVLGYLELLTSGDQGPIPDRQLKSLKVIARNAERLGEMVGDLLTLSRIEAGTFNLDRGIVAVGEMVEAAIEGVAEAAAAGGLDVEVDVPANLRVDGDAAQLQRVVGNLAGNAVKFTPHGGRIRVEAHLDGRDHVRITVSDSGSGIPRSEQDNLFKAFFRGSNAVTNATQGPGLGLAVVQSIIEQHRGSVELVSEVGVGTQVSVTLPRAATVPGPQSRAAAASRQ
jgi:signal transduction histidine kinase